MLLTIPTSRSLPTGHSLLSLTVWLVPFMLRIGTLRDSFAVTTELATDTPASTVNLVLSTRCSDPNST